MASEQTIKIPDIGGAQGVDVIEVLVQEGDKIEPDSSLITLESDKASMEIPSPVGGKVKKMLLKVGDKVSEGDDIVLVEVEQSASADGPAEQTEQKETKASSVKEEKSAPQPDSKENKQSKSGTVETILIPDIGGATDVDVIDVLVSVNETIEKEQALITLEGDKATMDIPAPYAGTVKSLHVKVGDKVSEGAPVIDLTLSETTEPDNDTASTSQPETTRTQQPSTEIEKQAESEVKMSEANLTTATSDNRHDKAVHAGPAVRRLAHELGVDLSKVSGTGRKGRITKDDLAKFVKSVMESKQQGGSGIAVSPMPEIDFSQFGEIEVKPLNKIKRLTGENVHRSWVTIPHVTQFDEADITDLEAFRKAEKEAAKKAGYSLTLLAFVTKALCQTLKSFPQFNASIAGNGNDLIYKSYYNIGIAVDTPNGLVVPVIKQVDQLTVAEIAKEMGRLSQKARDKKLMPADMSGGCMTISSLGGIGGTAFTPIVNGPEVAILGLSRSCMKPVYIDGAFEPRLMLPLSLSYDHRVIDGAEAARFTVHLADLLGDIRRIILG